MRLATYFRNQVRDTRGNESQKEKSGVDKEKIQGGIVRRSRCNVELPCNVKIAKIAHSDHEGRADCRGGDAPEKPWSEDHCSNSDQAPRRRKKPERRSKCDVDIQGGLPKKNSQSPISRTLTRAEMSGNLSLHRENGGAGFGDLSVLRRSKAAPCCAAFAMVGRDGRPRGLPVPQHRFANLSLPGHQFGDWFRVHTQLRRPA